MSPVVPEAWKPRLRRYLRERRGEEATGSRPVTCSPGQSVFIRFPDGSHVLFRNAFAVRDDGAGEVLGLTEHCG